jgi:hypothetical protein
MESCPFYHQEQPRDPSAAGASVIVKSILWCGQPRHSPQRRREAFAGIGELRCEGKLERCPLTPYHLNDF